MGFNEAPRALGIQAVRFHFHTNIFPNTYRSGGDSMVSDVFSCQFTFVKLKGVC